MQASSIPLSALFFLLVSRNEISFHLSFLYTILSLYFASLFVASAWLLPAHPSTSAILHLSHSHSTCLGQTPPPACRPGKCLSMAIIQKKKAPNIHGLQTRERRSLWLDWEWLALHSCESANLQRLQSCQCQKIRAKASSSTVRSY